MAQDVPQARKNCTHYEVLQVAADATFFEIKTAYHRAARQSHPDKQQNRDATFRRVQLAWECLRQDPLRRAYDEKLRVKEQKEHARVASAIPLEPSDCHLMQVMLHEEGEKAAQESEKEVTVYVYSCRCGEELDLLSPKDDDSPEQESGGALVDCPGCSLTYDCQALWEETNNNSSAAI